MSDRPEGKAKGRLLGLLLDAKDGTFARLAIGVAKRGSILTPQLESECEEAAQKGKSPDNSVAKVSFPSGAYGYTGLVMLGSGGSGERIVATWPDRGIDLQISIYVPSSGLAEDKETQAYQKIINEGGSVLVGKLLESLKHVFHKIETSDLRVSAENATIITPTNLPHAVPTTSQNPSTRRETNPVTTSDASSTPWFVWLVIIGAAIGLLWLLLKKRK